VKGKLSYVWVSIVFAWRLYEDKYNIKGKFHNKTLQNIDTVIR